jgi:hypothetical protein
MTTTGQWAWWVTSELVEPIIIREKPPAPRDPTTIMSASVHSDDDARHFSHTFRCWESFLLTVWTAATHQ